MAIFVLDGLGLRRNGVVVVLNTGGSCVIISFALDETFCNMEPIPFLTISLGQINDNPPFFVTSPVQIGFSPDGNFLVVKLKGINPNPSNIGEIRI